jgi:hypothetical protein
MIKIKSGLPFFDEVMILVIHILAAPKSEKPEIQQLRNWKELKENFEALLKSAQMPEKEKEQARQMVPQVIKTAESKQYIQCFSKPFNDEIMSTSFNATDMDQLYFFATLSGRQALYSVFKKLAGKFMVMAISGLIALGIMGIVIFKLITRI